MRLGTALAILVPAFLLFLFVAPVVPVGRTIVDAGSGCPGGFEMRWTDWQSVGYTVFGIGYHPPIRYVFDLCH